MIELYSWPTPNGHKLHIMLEEVGLDYKVHPINIGKGEQFDESFLRLSPNNRIPAMVDNDGPEGKSISLFESGAMLIYLADKVGKFLSSEVEARYTTFQWLMWQMGGVGPMFGQSNHFSHYAPEKIDYAIDRYNNECRRLYNVMDKRLNEVDYLAGDYSIADIATFPWARGYERRDVEISEFPSVSRWLTEIDNRPAVMRGMKILTNLREENKKFTDEEREVLFGAAQFKKR